MLLLPSSVSRTDTLFPFTTHFRSPRCRGRSRTLWGVWTGLDSSQRTLARADLQSAGGVFSRILGLSISRVNLPFLAEMQVYSVLGKSREFCARLPRNYQCPHGRRQHERWLAASPAQIGRASWRARVCQYV